MDTIFLKRVNQKVPECMCHGTAGALLAKFVQQFT